MKQKQNHFLPGPLKIEDPTCRIVLVAPLIPENTGNISRTCVGLNAELHLVEPLGFEITESRVKRAGLDYWSHLSLTIHSSFEELLKVHDERSPQNRIWLIETSGEKSLFAQEVRFQKGDWLVFGQETKGLSLEIMDLQKELEFVASVFLPMLGPIRSLNLSNSVSATAFELLRQVTVANAVC